jgi:protein-S-isoprenylcysteine O-methyltransferase
MLRESPYLFCAALVALELFTRRPDRSEARGRDGGTFWTMQVLIFASLTAAFWMWGDPRVPGLRLPAWTVAAGAALLVAGMAIRLWAIRSLGRFFTRKVQVAADQPVVERGPYRWVRHPSYTGGILEFWALGLSFGSLWPGLLSAVVPTVAYLLRLRHEEAVLAETIGEPYRAYMGRTKRLIPFVV